MNRHRVQNKKWPLAIVLMLLIANFCLLFLKFDMMLTFGITVAASVIFVSLGERLVGCQGGNELADLHLSWGVSSITALTIAIYFIERGTYITSHGYNYWIFQMLEGNAIHIDLQVGTLILMYYIIFLGIYGKMMWKIAKQNINEWIPDFWCVLGGVGLVLYIKEGFDHAVRTMTLLIIGALLVGYLICRYVASREQKIVYYISARRYLAILVGCLLIVVGIGVSLPEYQELLGARWIRQVTSVFNGSIGVQNKVPLETRLNDEFTLSDAVLFEVKASEPLYLREIAYKNYEDGIWSIPTRNEKVDSYILLKPKYLQAEYLQTQALLDEIAYQHSQNKNIFFDYADMGSYESSVSNKKQYTIIQNPINKINYFTVNGVTDIKDKNTSKIYYYQNINNCYFHGEKIIEPSNYTVEYYDHIPKMGSREYVFLHDMNATTWEKIYKQVVQNRIRYDYYYEGFPKVLLTYTPMVQYTNAKRDFLQVPTDLKEPLSTLARSVTLSSQSDWVNAEAICNFLKTQYTYCLHSKQRGEGDPIYNFLYENKEGICQDFASSMVLLCRSIGIPAKYVTGYLVTEKNQKTGNYIVREKDAHAFVEVYIAGYGWMTFDPTPVASGDEKKVIDKAEWNNSDAIKVMSIVVLVVMGVFIYRGGCFSLQEIAWKVTFRFLKPSKQIEKLMRRTIKWLEHTGYNREKYETLSQYGCRLKDEHLDIIQIVQSYEAYRYGNQVPDKKQLVMLYKAYKDLKKQLKNK